MFLLKAFRHFYTQFTQFTRYILIFDKFLPKSNHLGKQ